MKLVILGAGGIAHTHAQALQSNDSFQLVGVCGNIAAQVQNFAKQYNIRVYDKLEQVLADKNIEVVSVCTPSGLHADQGTLIAKAGKHVLLEKPIALTVAAAQKLIATCREQQVFIGAFFQRRLEEDVLRLKKLIDSGKLGQVFHLTLQMNWYRSPEYYAVGGWRGTWAMDGGGALMNQSIHYVDMVCNLLGDPQNVFARARTCLHKIEVDDLTIAILKFQNGSTCTYQATTAAYPGFETRVEVYGTQGSATLVNERLISIHTIDEEAFQCESKQAGAVSTPAVSFDNHAKLYKSFAAKLAVSADFDDKHAWELVRPNVVISAIYQSSQEQKLVDIHKPH